jgi:benzoyl-CoA reductase/2-hydroxyglutaryl-CoA dehydratase subunit BcrC/BadD/HgdB
MVQVDISQLSAECNALREKLRNYREELTQDETKLRQVAGKELTKEQLQDVEHLHNQFHIQLINIHDLKQSIKAHDRKINFEKAAFNGHANEDSLSKHEQLLGEYQQLEQTLEGLRSEFSNFLQRTK